MKYSFVAFLCLLFLISCKGNYTRIGSKNANYIPYYLKVYEADSLNIIGNYQRSNDILDSLFEKFEPLNLEGYGEYTTYLKNKIVLNDFKRIKKILKRAIKKFGVKPEYFIKDTLLSIALKESNFSESDLECFYIHYKKEMTLDYRVALDTMKKNDQFVRSVIPINLEELQKVDKNNALVIKQLISKYGYPSSKKIGRRDFNENNTNATLFFLHATTEARDNYILNLMWESVKKGECEPSDFAVVYDKNLHVAGSKALYGELRIPDKRLDEQVINLNKIDSIRKSVGLENLEYKRWKIKKLLGIDINN